MNYKIHKAETRGHANHGWLDTHHTFSFADYYDKERMNFGALRVLNDDIVQPGMGFGTHPHADMEIVSIPLRGALEHKDSLGHVSIINKGDVQVMSAGTGVRHSEYNHSRSEDVNFLQLWIFPRKGQLQPRYDQKTFVEEDMRNTFCLLVNPDTLGGLYIHQDAWLSLGIFDPGKTFQYSLKNEKSGVYLFIIEGEISLADQVLSKRDGIGIWDVSEIKFSAQSKAQILCIEVPLIVND
ncbi:MAG: pirin family protein [Bacteroidales bacterium]|nr:pirin family protein [Bacteroidales bacterium]